MTCQETPAAPVPISPPSFTLLGSQGREGATGAEGDGFPSSQLTAGTGGSPLTEDERAELARPDLATAVRQENRTALRAVVKAYLPQVLRAAHGAGLSPQQAEDVAQETFVTFLEIAPRFEGRSHVRTFLFGVLYRKIAESRRESARQEQHDPIDDAVESRFAANGSWIRPPLAADTLVRVEEVRRFLAECLEASPTPQRLAFHLREVEGLARREICQALEVTSSNLDVMLHRLRNRTRECLEGKGVSKAP